MERQALIEASAQPGGRTPAPASLALVQAFVNTVDREHGPDLLDDAEGWAAWCTHRGFAPAPLSRFDAQLIREALRDLLWVNAGHRDPQAAARQYSEGSVLDRAAFDVQVLHARARYQDFFPPQ